MKTAIAAALLIAALPVCAFAQAPAVPAKPLIQPADANKDGKVTEDERLDYLARKSAGAQDQPGLPVSAPKPGGNSTVIMGKPGGQTPYQTGIAGEHPEGASDFEKATEDRIRQDAKDD